MTTFNEKVKTLLKLKTQLELYEMTIQRNLERLEQDIEKIVFDNPSSFAITVLEETELNDLVRGTAETVETIFLKTRHMLRQFPLDTVAQERLETLGINFDVDVEKINAIIKPITKNEEIN